jgi:hypothetical protein
MPQWKKDGSLASIASLHAIPEEAQPYKQSSGACSANQSCGEHVAWLASHFSPCLIRVILPQTLNATVFTKISRLQLFSLLICASYRHVFQIVTEVLEIIRLFSIE